jgi:hypothetical protein
MWEMLYSYHTPLLLVQPLQDPPLCCMPLAATLLGLFFRATVSHLFPSQRLCTCPYRYTHSFYVPVHAPPIPHTLSLLAPILCHFFRLLLCVWTHFNHIYSIFAMPSSVTSVSEGDDHWALLSVWFFHWPSSFAAIRSSTLHLFAFQPQHGTFHHPLSLRELMHPRW